MKTILMANVGNRDVKYENEDIKPTRLTGKDYLERFDQTSPHLTFPILRKGLECIFSELQDQPLDYLILFYTDQDPQEVADQHYKSDTIYFAELIERLIKIRLPEKIREIRRLKIPANPNDYDSTYEYFSGQLEQIEAELHPDRVFLSPAGGIPACNMNLLLQGSRIFNRRAVTLLIPENPDKPAKLQKLGELINRENKRQIMRRLIDEYNFGGVAELLENETDPVAKSLLYLARAMQYRLYFDFKSALNFLNKVKPDDLEMPTSKWNSFGSVENLLNIFKDNLNAVIPQITSVNGDVTDPIQKENWLQLQTNLNAEVLLNAKIKWLSKQYIDFLGRIFRLQEGVLRWVFEKETGFSADALRFPADFGTYLERDPDFAKYLNDNSINGKTPVTPHLNRGTLLLFLNYINTKNQKYKAVLKQCNKLDHLAALRNKCALAHGNIAINEQIITEKYPKNVWKNLSGLTRAFNLPDLFPQVECIKNILIEKF